MNVFVCTGSKSQTKPAEQATNTKPLSFVFAEVLISDDERMRAEIAFAEAQEEIQRAVDCRSPLESSNSPMRLSERYISLPVMKSRGVPQGSLCPYWNIDLVL